MKKTLKYILALTLVLTCLVALVSCGAKPKLNLEKAAEKLEDNDYYASYTDDEDDLSYGMKERLSASDGEDQIYIIKFSTKKLAKLYYQQATLSIKNEIEELKLELKTYKYELRKFDKDMDSDEIDSYEDEIKDLKDEIEELEESLKFIGRSGKYVWVASSKDAIKATK